MAITVGLAGRLRREGNTRCWHIYNGLKEMGRVLADHGLPQFIEPLDYEGAGFEFELATHGIAELQRLALYVWFDEKLPSPGFCVGEPLLDPRARTFYKSAMFWAAMRRNRPNSLGQEFAHLVCHHNAHSGRSTYYWIPVDFPGPLELRHSDRTYTNTIGSSVRLKKECEDIAGWLKLPLDLDPQSEEKLMGMTISSVRRWPWEDHPVEAIACLALHRACLKSLELGAAVLMDWSIPSYAPSAFKLLEFSTQR